MDDGSLSSGAWDALQRRIALEQTVARMSRQLLVADGDALDAAIESALAQLGEFVGADRAYVFQFRDDDIHVYNSHEWCAASISPQKEALQQLEFVPESAFGAAMKAGQLLDVPDVAHMVTPLAYEREMLLAQGIQSLLVAPLQYRQRLMGFVGFDAVHRQRRWTPEDHALLELAVDGIRNSLIRRRAELALRASEHRMRDLFDRTPQIAVQGYDESRRVVFWNQASEDLYGYTAEEAEGRLLEDLIIPAPMRDYVVQAHRDWLHGGVEIPAGEITLRRKDGSAVDVFSSHLLRRTPEGEVEMYCVDIDLTAQKAAQASLQLAARVIENAREGIVVIDHHGLIVEVNPAVCAATGHPREALLGTFIDRLQQGGHAESLWATQWSELQEAGAWSGECLLLRADGSTFPALATLSALLEPDSGRPQRVVALYADISLQKAHEAELHFMATHDALTGLPNRSLLRDRLMQALLRSQRSQERVAVAYIDLDRFKEVNDTYGHAVGDDLLKRVTANMQAVMRGVDTLARLGGDEFVAVLVDLPHEGAALPLLERMQAAIAQAMEVQGHRLVCTASMGVAFGGAADAADADTLLRQADQAMYQAKLGGKNRCALFDTQLDRLARLQHENEARLAQALTAGELVLHYQPQVHLRTGEVVGCEALLRWQHPERGLLLPGEFLAYAQGQELCTTLGEWVLRAALKQLTRWLAAGLRIKMCVNIAGAHFLQPSFVPRLTALLLEHATVPRELLVLELLESSSLGSLDEVAEIIRLCRSLGVGVALDDFGTGYSSLTYLKQLPANVLKIDRSFVRDMLHDDGDRAILSGILLLGQAFGRTVVAEGVETEAQGQGLIALGCELAQGYGIARPMPGAELLPWAARWQPPQSWRSA
ncbi:MAG: EAL domain-containing protein [Serpentinimonas sp.]|jgi:diguanylate cyclase (GGDEF)-like protein/PAS domain S-box-containing protein|nr:EAL domain-containing protein [Serpentinimonas sp.]